MGKEATEKANSKLLLSRLSVLMDETRIEEMASQVVGMAMDNVLTKLSQEEPEGEVEYEDDWQSESDDEMPELIGQTLREKCRALFDQLDDNKDGHLTRGEVLNAADGLKKLLKESRIFKKKQVLKMFKQGDIDQNGTLDFEEFYSYIELSQERARYAQGPLIDDATVRNIFFTMDKDGDGEITEDELKLAYAGILLKAGEKVDPKKVAKWAKTNFKKYDTDGSKALDMDEFKELLVNAGALAPMRKEFESGMGTDRSSRKVTESSKKGIDVGDYKEDDAALIAAVTKLQAAHRGSIVRANKKKEVVEG